MEELKDHVAKLNSLLQDPHPGLSTWCEFYYKHIQWIVDYWNNN